jgi:hypothetical protein
VRPSCCARFIDRGGALLVLCLLVAGCSVREPSHAQAPTAAAVRLMPSPARLATAPPELQERLATSPIALFRFVNGAWTREVCAAFDAELRTLPTARLHGDAHVEQYAVTATARGLDDFDDSARGPAVVDITRFLGSLELTARERGWSASLPAVVDAFFAGYARGLEDAAYLPPDPAVVTRLRAMPARSPTAFLAWADSLMQPLAPGDEARVDRAWARVEAYAEQVDGEFTRAFLARKKMGALHLGIGSALARKILFRVEGPSTADDDDVVLEVKEVLPLGQDSCVSVPASAEVFRVVEGLRQLGRLQHRLVVALPVVADGQADTRGWWLKTWDRSYREVEIADLASPDDLRELAHDAGAQLGATNLMASPLSPSGPERLIERDTIRALEPRIRQVAHDLTRALLEAWRELNARSSPLG